VRVDGEAVRWHLAAEFLRLTGRARLRLTGTSMLPAARPGDVLSICMSGASHALPGDIVLFARNGRLVAHRVVERVISQDRPFWITRGDRLRHNDPPVSRDELLGRITAIQRGNRRIVPRLTFWSRLASWLLCRSEFCTRVMVHFTRRDGARVTYPGIGGSPQVLIPPLPPGAPFRSGLNWRTRDRQSQGPPPDRATTGSNASVSISKVAAGLSRHPENGGVKPPLRYRD
jgi:hypothetical protein